MRRRCPSCDRTARPRRSHCPRCWSRIPKGLRRLVHLHTAVPPENVPLSRVLRRRRINAWRSWLDSSTVPDVPDLDGDLERRVRVALAPYRGLPRTRDNVRGARAAVLAVLLPGDFRHSLRPVGARRLHVDLEATVGWDGFLTIHEAMEAA